MSVKRLEKLLSFIQEPKNYLTGFPYVIESCAIAMELKRQLWEAGEIGDNESLAISEKIQKAKRNAIETHKTFVINRLKQNKNHTIETIVSSIYDVIF